MDPLSQHACEAAATSRCKGNVAMTRQATAPDRHELSHLREELQRGVRFTQQDENQNEPSMRRHYSSLARDRGEPVDDAQCTRLSPMYTDGSGENDDDEFAAFLGLGLSIDTPSDTLELPVPHRAASFSGSSRPRLVPCSPPVPIPQTPWQRRSSLSSTAGSRSSSGSMLIPSHEHHQYSRTQCEARLWDEYWNYKLSLESRESFEASTASTSTQRDGQESPLPSKADRVARRSHGQKPMQRTTSEASTDDTAHDSGEELLGDTVEADVFDMDDL